MPTREKCSCSICTNDEDHDEKDLHRDINILMGELSERQRRLFAGLEAKRYGHGGIKKVSIITGLDRKTIRRGMKEMKKGKSPLPPNRSRKEGGGRKLLEKKVKK